MPYSTYTDVASEFKDIDFTSVNSKVLSTEVTEFISQADSLIDAAISNKYEVPVTGTASLKLLKMISILLVRDRILEIIAAKTGNDETSQDPTKKYLISPKDMLKSISKGDMKLVDAVVISGGGVSSFNVDHSIKHVFKKGVDQW